MSTTEIITLAFYKQYGFRERKIVLEQVTKKE